MLPHNSNSSESRLISEPVKLDSVVQTLYIMAPNVITDTPEGKVDEDSSKKTVFGETHSSKEAMTNNWSPGRSFKEDQADHE